MDRLLQEIGIGISYTQSFRYPDSYLPLIKNIPDEAKTKEILDKAEDKIKKAILDIENEEIKLPGKPLFGKLMAKISSKTGPDKKDKNMSVDDSCILCGLCQSICPSNNITMGEKKAIIGDGCLHCYACYNNCPKEAIKYTGRSGHYKSLVKVEELKRR